MALVGTVPRGLPSFVIPDAQLLWAHAGTVAIAAVALVMIGFSQTAGDARAFAGKHRYRIDIDQESLAQGIANVGAGVFQGMPVSTSLSASSLNDHSGARSGFASLTSGIVVLLTLLVLAPLFSDLPKPVLAAVIIEAVVMGMMDVPEMRRLARVKRFDFWIAVAAIIGTLVFGVLAGVMIGIALSLVWLISVTTRPPMPLLGREPGTEVFRELDEHPDDERFPGVVVIRLDGGLFFATSDALEDRIRDVALSTEGVTAVVLDCEGIDFIDSQGAAKLGEIVELAEHAGIDLRLARVKPEVSDVLRRDGVLDRLGAGKIHGNVHRAVQARHRPGIAPLSGPSTDDVARPETEHIALRTHERAIGVSDMGKKKAKKKHTTRRAPAPRRRRRTIRAAGPPAKMKRKEYEREMRILQGELVAMQEWVKTTGARVCIVFEGVDSAGKGGTIRRITERTSPRVFKHIALPAPDRARQVADVHPTLRGALPLGRGGRDLRPQLVQPGGRRARHGLLHTRGHQAIPRRGADGRESDGRRRDHPRSNTSSTSAVTSRRAGSRVASMTRGRSGSSRRRT